MFTDQGIVQLYYYFEEQHNVLLLMEYASGGALFSYIRKARVGDSHTRSAEDIPVDSILEMRMSIPWKDKSCRKESLREFSPGGLEMEELWYFERQQPVD